MLTIDVTHALGFNLLVCVCISHSAPETVHTHIPRRSINAIDDLIGDYEPFLYIAGRGPNVFCFGYLREANIDLSADSLSSVLRLTEKYIT